MNQTNKQSNICSLQRVVKSLALRPYSESQLELKSILSDILPVNCKFIFDFTSILSDKIKT